MFSLTSSSSKGEWESRFWWRNDSESAHTTKGQRGDMTTRFSTIFSEAACHKSEFLRAFYYCYGKTLTGGAVIKWPANHTKKQTDVCRLVEFVIAVLFSWRCLVNVNAPKGNFHTYPVALWHKPAWTTRWPGWIWGMWRGTALADRPCVSPISCPSASPYPLSAYPPADRDKWSQWLCPC